MYPSGTKQSLGGGPGCEASGSSKESASYSPTRGWLCIFSCALQYKVTGKFQRSKIPEKMCMFIFLAGQYFANFKSKQRVTDQ